MGRTLTPKETVDAANRAVGKKGYDLVDGNCEHFASKCKTGKPRSKQVETVESFEAVDILFLPYALPVAIKEHFFDKK